MLERASNTLRAAFERVRGGPSQPPDLLAAGRRQLSRATLMALGLQRQPFNDHTPPENLYADDAIRMQVGMLARQIADGEVLGLLQGEPGSGKTSLLIRLMSDNGDHVHFFVARGGIALTGERIVTDMLRVLVRPAPADPARAYRELVHRLRRLTTDGHPAALVVDDADRIVDAELQNLVAVNDSLRAALPAGFRLLLAGQPGLESRVADLEGDQPRAGRVVTTGVRPLRAACVGEFLEQRLRLAGLTRSLPLDDADLSAICAQAGGLPRDIEIAATALLESRYGDATIV